MNILNIFWTDPYLCKEKHIQQPAKPTTFLLLFNLLEDISSRDAAADAVEEENQHNNT